MQTILLMLHLIIAVLIIVLILMQRGRGADVGSAFGSGASQTLFGSRGSASFIVKMIGVLIAIFFMSSIILNRVIAEQVKQQQLANTPSVLLAHKGSTKT